MPYRTSASDTTGVREVTVCSLRFCGREGILLDQSVGLR